MFEIIVPFFNAGPWIKNCLDSLRNQKNCEFKCLVINDASTDKSDTIVQSLHLDSRFAYITNSNNKGALYNIVNGYKSLNSISRPESILTVLDGDDSLNNENALAIVAKYYNQNPQLLLTYGNWIGSNGQKSNCQYFPDQILNTRNFRAHPPFITSHLRTYKSKLWFNIREDDLKDPILNEYFRAGWDVAFMMPMLEMAGKDRILFIEDLIVTYNVNNPISDAVIKGQYQMMVDRYIRSLPTYGLLS